MRTGPKPAAPPADLAVPAGCRLRPDPGTRWLADRSVLLGGSPPRLLRLTPTGAALAWHLLAGRPVRDRAEGRLARLLLDGGLAHLAPGPPPPLSVAVVVPVRDDPEGLDGLLDRLLDDTPGEHGRPGAEAVRPLVQEVLVVDDGSVDPSALRAVLQRHAPRSGAPGRLRLLRRPTPGGPGRARNLGAAASRAELLVFVDADVALPGPPASWLPPLLAHFADPALGALAPRVRAAPPERAPNRPLADALAAYEAIRGPLDRGGRPGPVGAGRAVPFVPSTVLLVRRAALVHVGGFAPALRVGEDVDFVWRLDRAGWRVRYDPTRSVAHRSRDRLGPWLAQRFRYGTSAAPLAERHPGALAPLALGPAQAAAALALADGAVPLALGALGVGVARVARQLPSGPGRIRLALALSAAGQRAAAAQAARTLRGPWAPLALALWALAPRARPALAAAVLLPSLADARRALATEGRPGAAARALVLGLADDLAYGAGVLLGCLRRAHLAPLRPAWAPRSGLSPRGGLGRPRAGKDSGGRAGGSRQSPTSPLQLLAAARPEDVGSGRGTGAVQ
jgi:mycofactocin system glycosyltransferase